MAKKAVKRITRTQRLRNYLASVPGATLDEICKATKFDRKFVGTVCSQRVRRGEFERTEAGGWRLVAGYTARRAGDDDLPPRVTGNRAALRAEKRTARAGKPLSADDVARKHLGGGRAGCCDDAGRAVEHVFGVGYTGGRRRGSCDGAGGARVTSVGAVLVCRAWMI